MREARIACRIPYSATRLFLQEIEEDAYLP